MYEQDPSYVYFLHDDLIVVHYNCNTIVQCLEHIFRKGL